MQPNEVPIFIFPAACWAPNFLVKMETVRILCKYALSLGANILSLQLVLSFSELSVHDDYIKDERGGWGGRLGAREEQSTREVQEEPAELLEGKMQQEPICSAPLPRQSQRNDRASPSFCSSCVHSPICVSTSVLARLASR